MLFHILNGSATENIKLALAGHVFQFVVFQVVALDGNPVPKPQMLEVLELGTAERVSAIVPLVFGKINGGKGGFNQWTINGKSFSENDAPRKLQKGKRYRLVFDNQTDDPHPVHLHRNCFELTNVYGKPTAGVTKDVVLVKGYGKIEADFVLADRGLTLFHCHRSSIWTTGSKRCSTLSRREV